MNESTLAYGRHGDMSYYLAPALEGERKRKFYCLIKQMRQAVDEIYEAGDECPPLLLTTNFQTVIDLTAQALLILRGG